MRARKVYVTAKLVLHPRGMENTPGIPRDESCVPEIQSLAQPLDAKKRKKWLRPRRGTALTPPLIGTGSMITMLKRALFPIMYTFM